MSNYDQWKTASPHDADLDYIKDLEKELILLNDGRNLECWPLCSFGWKDADLDPWGCTGIESINPIDEEQVEVFIGGHKTVTPAREWYEYDQMEKYVNDIEDIQFEIVCDYGDGEWTGDEWSMSFHERFTTCVVYDNDYEVDFKATAKLIVEMAEGFCDIWSKDMIKLDEQMEALFKEYLNLYTGEEL
jgi:hypothetical protein